VDQASTEHHRTVREAVLVIGRNRIVRWVIGGLLAALCSVLATLGSVGLFTAKRELGNLTQAISGQTAAVAKVQEKLGGLENRLGDISEKLVRVEERHASHAHRIDEIVNQVSELRRRIDQFTVERDERRAQWDAMREYKKDEDQERTLIRLVKQLLARMKANEPRAS
jgi:septal ring factor EnvC (AmiA/AmiB activator)